MRRRVAIISLAVLVSGVAILGYFIQQGRSVMLTDPYKAVSADACIVIETSDLQGFLNSVTAHKGIFSELGRIKEFSGFSVKLQFLTDQVNKPSYKKLFQGGRAVIAFFDKGGGDLTPLLSFAVPPDLGARQMKESLIASGIKNIRELKAGGLRSFQIPFSEGESKDTIFIDMGSGLLTCSTSGKIARRAVMQKGAGSDIRSVPGYSRVLLSSGNGNDKLFIVFGKLPAVIRRLLLPGSYPLAEKVKRLAGCAAGDIFMNNNRIDISGYTACSDSADLLFRFNSIVPGGFLTYKILPSATALFESVKGSYSAGSGPGSGPGNLAGRLRPFLGNEITRAFIDIKNNPAGENSVLIYELTNRVACENIFREQLGKQVSVINYQPDEQTVFPVYSTGKSGVAEELSPGFAHGFGDLYYAFIDNFMITGNSYITISRILYDNILNKTLANDRMYQEFEKLLQSRAGYLFYCVPSHIVDYLEGYLDRSIINGLRSNRDVLNKLQSVGFQMAAINGMLYNNLSVQYKEEVMEESNAEWQTLLDTVAAIKPFFFTNHNTGAKEIFIQDLSNNAYLINTAGRVLWKVPLKERITGQVYMIDYYRNGKYQLLFSGRNYLHVLDRNGNYVERYPVRLRSRASSPLALFDYDNNQNYRLVIAGEDKMVYSYEKNGSVVKGWKAFRTAGTVASEPTFYRVSGKDYIVVADESSLYFLDRSGNERLKLKAPVTKARGSTLRLSPGSESYLVCSAPDGTVQDIYFSGNVTKFSLGQFSADHSFDFFDVDGDGFGEYIFIDKGILYIYDNNHGEMFRKDFKSGSVGGPINFIFSSADRKTGVFDIRKNLIYLIDSKGNVMSGFPLRGASMFSIGRLTQSNDWHLIVGGTDRFLYNYKIETAN